MAARPGGDQLRDVDAYWRACNYLALGMLSLRDNPLLREPLAVGHLEQRLVKHWGSDPVRVLCGSTSIVSSRNTLVEHLAYANEHGVDEREIQDWKWTP